MNLSELPSPALLFFEDRIVENTRRVIARVGGVARLRPHVKTHKCAEIIALQRALGIDKFKAATIAEAEMTARAGAAEVLVAYPLVGPNVERFLALVRTYPRTRFQAVFDSHETSEPLALGAKAAGLVVEVLVDVDPGLHRTGVPLDQAEALCLWVASLPGLRLIGIHAYDGHHHQSDLAVRTQAAQALQQEVFSLKRRLESQGLELPVVVMGGTPTFPLYADLGGVEVSPGTCFLHDSGYTTAFPDQVFEPAALVLTRVLSVHPAQNTFTLDLGHKALAADPPGQRGILWGQPAGFATPLFQNEEHWVWTVGSGPLPRVGDEFLVQPTHICPTVNLYARAHIIDGQGQWTKDWPIVARDRSVGI